MLVHIHPSLVFFLCFSLLLQISLLSCFLLSNVGCGSHYYQIPRSTDPQAHVSILSHFSSFEIPTLSHFSSDVGVPLWETNMFLSHNFPMSMSHNHATLKMTHLSCVLQNAPSTFFILSHFLRMWMQDTCLFHLPFSHVLCPATRSPTFYRMTLSLS
jgi:hypothetical protein